MLGLQWPEWCGSHQVCQDGIDTRSPQVNLLTTLDPFLIGHGSGGWKSGGGGCRFEHCDDTGLMVLVLTMMMRVVVDEEGEEVRVVELSKRVDSRFARRRG